MSTLSFKSPYLDSVAVDGGKFQAALLRGAQDPAREVFYGNSNFAGQGAGTGGAGMIGAARSSISMQIALGHGCNVQSFFGEQNISVCGANPAEYDPRLALSGAWQADPAPHSTFGGRFYVAFAKDDGQLVFSPTEPWDQVTVYWPQAPMACDAVSVLINGEAVDVINQSGSHGFQSKTYAASLGMNVLAFKAHGNGSAYILGAVTRDSSSAQPIAYFGSCCGGGTEFLATDAYPWAPLSVLRLINPDRVHIYEMMNDCFTGVSIHDAQRYLEKIIDACPNADIVFYVPMPDGVSPGPANGYFDDYKRIMLNLLHDRGVGALIDCRSVLGSSFNRAAQRGYCFDGAHPSLAGHTAMARLSLSIVP